MKRKILTFAVIQDGYCVFGTGSTALEAYTDACEWLGPMGSGDDYTPDDVAAECAEHQFNGDLMLIERSDDPDEFDSYMRNQGGFVQAKNGNWHAD